MNKCKCKKTFDPTPGQVGMSGSEILYSIGLSIIIMTGLLYFLGRYA